MSELQSSHLVCMSAAVRDAVHLVDVFLAKEQQFHSVIVFVCFKIQGGVDLNVSQI